MLIVSQPRDCAGVSLPTQSILAAAWEEQQTLMQGATHALMHWHNANISTELTSGSTSPSPMPRCKIRGRILQFRNTRRILL